jgi:hypothetical protein
MRKNKFLQVLGPRRQIVVEPDLGPWKLCNSEILCRIINCIPRYYVGLWLIKQYVHTTVLLFFLFTPKTSRIGEIVTKETSVTNITPIFPQFIFKLFGTPSIWLPNLSLLKSNKKCQFIIIQPRYFSHKGVPDIFHLHVPW